MKSIKEIRKLISENKIEIVFNELEERFESKPSKRDLLISIKNQYHQIKYENIEGVITYENETVGKSRVISRLLKLVSDEKDSLESDSNTRKKKSAKLFKYIFKSVNPKISNSTFKAAFAVFVLSCGVYGLRILLTNGSFQSQFILSEWIKEIEPLIGKTISFSIAANLILGMVNFKVFNNQFLLSLGECFLYIYSTTSGFVQIVV